ncbi:M23 family metallopeptidase [Microbacterium sp.]|uniref:peptidoglycan DD-metalloendopeptidase family protein n=2 Tax=Microbacterium TaxID=33882 RepID=UPI00257A67AC|nr:M23 family metallopeptidase [Microbacterium sp.]
MASNMLHDRMSRRGLLAVVATGFAALVTTTGNLPAGASVTDYPSWEEVEAARASESETAKKVQQIQSLIRALEEEVSSTREDAATAADDFYRAQQASFAAALRADTLQSQATAQAQTAEAAAVTAGRLASQLYRDGGDSSSIKLFVSGSTDRAEELLSRLGVMEKLLEKNQAAYANAVSARDAAQSLADQAEVARQERDQFQRSAERAMTRSQRAADAASEALDTQSSHLLDLEAQLAALRDTRAKTAAAYQLGVAAARAEEKKRQAERAAAERLGGSRGVTNSGWTRPTAGGLTSRFGPRTSQCGPSYCSSSNHYGVDLSGGCGAEIYAAASGTVVYAGYNGGYGNYIKVDHGDGVGTGYAHIRDGGYHVRYGQRVDAGTLIGREGSTGTAFGCNLHFEVYLNEAPVDPAAFLSARGVAL